MLKRTPKSGESKRDKINALREQQRKWMSEMQLEKKTPSQSRQQTPIPPIVEKKQVDIITDNWYELDTAPKSSDALLSCPICKSNMTKPHIVIPCGHSFCEACLEIHKAKTNQCHVCLNPMQGDFLNRALEQLLAQQRATTEQKTVSQYKQQYDQLVNRCAILKDELESSKSESAAHLEQSTRIVRESTVEIKEIHQMILHYEKKMADLDTLVTEHQQSIKKNSVLVEELSSREHLIKETLSTLTKRKEKVKIIWSGIESNVKNQ
ncbi:hypothetical protein EDD86DRAFT_265941 [Gorgonomyces haynaldii]|nr:hypothetical protein EDD86DRAFT_265941 [Gorgonomyces haynaldii]